MSCENCSCNCERLATPRLGQLRVKKKVLLNQDRPDHLEVAIGEIELVNDSEIHYIVSFGGGNSVRIIGNDNWNKFVEMIRWLAWNPADTIEGPFNVDEWHPVCDTCGISYAEGSDHKCLTSQANTNPSIKIETFEQKTLDDEPLT